MLPGFFSRLHSSLLSTLQLSHPPSPPPSPPLASAPTPRSFRHAKLNKRLSTLRTTPRYAPLVPLAPHIAITNDASRSPSIARPKASGQAPAFAPSLLSWIGGSLAGALKTGGDEIKRESWDEAREKREAAAAGDEEALGPGGFVLPDWTSQKMGM